MLQLVGSSDHDQRWVKVDFKRAQLPKSVILHMIFFYARYPVSYRDLQQILAECGIAVDYAMLNRWDVRYSPQIAVQAQMRMRPTVSSWRIDENYIKFEANGLIYIKQLIARAKS